mmetsp:Transcript_100322/g.181051  ORF Transcript_100322/g.181051 Transcript_100322/m.181051 type:complete len:297 (-) Transcript_100322:302-1192(-)
MRWHPVPARACHRHGTCTARACDRHGTANDAQKTFHSSTLLVGAEGEVSPTAKVIKQEPMLDIVTERMSPYLPQDQNSNGNKYEACSLLSKARRCCRRQAKQSSEPFSAVKLVIVEIARRSWRILSVLCLKQVPCYLHLLLIRGSVIRARPELALAGIAVQIRQVDLTCVLVVPSTITISGRNSRALAPWLSCVALIILVQVRLGRALARETVPDAALVMCVVLREWEVSEIIAAHVIAVLAPIHVTLRPCALARVKGDSHPKVHVLVHQRLRGPHQYLQPHDAADTELVRGPICS